MVASENWPLGLPGLMGPYLLVKNSVEANLSF
jgi:hypothetical protein